MFINVTRMVATGPRDGKEKYIQKRTTNGSHHLLAIEKFNKDGLSVG